MRRVTKVFKTLASAVMVSGAALALVLPSAAALPPGGADDSTEGTSSTVTGSVEAGGTLSFSLSGFPAGETVSIKIDDGALDGSDNSVSGTGVVHQQKIGANGSVSGSFVLPSYVKPGTHWLRFLASQEIPESQGGGTKGFSNRSPQFTVTGSASDSGDQGGAAAAGSGSGASGAGGSSNAGGAGGAGSGSDSGAGANGGVGAAGVAGSQATASAGASAKPTSGTLKVTASPSAKKQAQPAATTVTTIVAMEQSSKSAFPVLGVSVFSAALLIGAVAIGAVLLRNRRRAGAAAAASGAAGAGAGGAGAGKSAGAGAGAGKSAGAGGVGNSPGPAA